MIGGGLVTKLIIAGVVLAVLGGVGLYIKSIIDQNAMLKGDKRQLETAVDLKDDEIAVYQDMASTRAESAQESRTALWAAEAQVNELEAKLERHDLSLLIKRKPGLITRRMKAGASRAHRGIEDAANETLQ